MNHDFTAADVDKALSDAKQFAREGLYEEALERHLWYHHNALVYDPAQDAVRLSFAIHYWAELGKVYPRALDALRATRDEALATYRKDPSDPEMFDEVMSIDFAIDDLAGAKDLFYEGRKNGLREMRLMLKLPRIVDADELKWVEDVVGDPDAALDEFKRNRERSRGALRDRKDLEAEMDGMWGREIAILLKAVAEVKGLSAAKALQIKALDVLDSPDVRDALKSG